VRRSGIERCLVEPRAAGQRVDAEFVVLNGERDVNQAGLVGDIHRKRAR